MKILKLIALLTAAACFSCSSGEPESVASTEQALTYCSTPAYAHIIDSVSNVDAIPSGPNCPAAYFSSEPQVWSLSPGVNTPPPQRGDGKCSCRWTTPGLCYNQLTNGLIADYECYAGACYYYRSFECGYRASGMPANDCSWKATYSMQPVQALGTTGNWNHTKMWLVVTEPGCKRIVTINDFHVLLP